MMFDPSERHSEPLGEALSYSSQRAAQMVSLLAAAAEVALRRRALHASRQAARDEQERRRLQAQENAFRAQVRAHWAPAFDAQWLAQADLLQTGRVWGAAAPWADTDPEAAAALRRAEERLRTLHPYAMTQYDRFCDQGASPLDAMRQSVHLFLREPHARPGQPGTARRQVEAGPPGTIPVPDSGIARGSGMSASGQDPYEEAERRGREIVERLQARAMRERGVELSPGELVTALEATSSLPGEVITRLARAEAEERLEAAAERGRAEDLGHAATAPSARGRAGDLQAARSDTLAADIAGAYAPSDRTVAQLAAESFPCTVADGIRAAAAGRLQPAAAAVRTAAVQNARHVGGST
jgi:hypothetical protein